MQAFLIRHTYADAYTAGALQLIDERANLLASCVTLELPWLDNRPQVSCIPEGAYQVVSRESEKFGMHYHVTRVPEREWILFHPGTYVSQLRGCILPGRAFADLNRDNIPDILDTRATLHRLLASAGERFTLHILSVPLSGGLLPGVTITAPAVAGP